MSAQTRCVVIAHRGASGYLPEHTTEAKSLAYGMGADYLEQDVVATRDAQLMVMHDTFLDDVTNVAAVFPGRAHPDGRHYAIDFDLAEIRQLSVVERRRSGTKTALFPGRFSGVSSQFRLATLREEIELIADLNRTTGRNVGIYPEIKEPRWHRERGIDLAALVLQELDSHGYRGSEAICYVQCFDAKELTRIRTELQTTLPLIQLLPEGSGPWQGIDASDAARLARYAVGVGVPYERLVLPRGGSGCNALRAAPLLDVLRSAGLKIHAYTLRRDKLPPWAPSLEELLRLLLGELGVDGVFCDHPDVAVHIRDSLD